MSTRSAPWADVDSEQYWNGLAEHRLVLQRCDACGESRFPPMPSCPYCGTTGFSLTEADGLGAVYSLVRVHRAFEPSRADEVPYTIAAVDLDAGPRVFARVEDAFIGDRCAAVFVDHDDWTELRFEVLR